MQVLLVDDEGYMLEYLKEIVDWAKYGFTKVYTAGSGSLARDLLDKYKPELLITDIRMPRISGLDLCQYIHENKYPTKSVILSGYGEFEYAQRAIQYGVSEYLVKPILEAEFEEMLKRMMEQYFSKQKPEAVLHQDDIIAVVTGYVKQNIEADLSLEVLAGAAHVNASYLSRYFKEATGQNISGYVTAAKMEHAAELLTKTEKKIHEIFTILGYQKGQHFTKLFKEHFGVTPKEYKQGKRKEE